MNRCISCKGKGLCGRPVCPISARFHAQIKTIPKTGYVGTAPSVFVGSAGYPSVNAGPLLTADSDHPPDWLQAGLGIDDIVSIRAQTIRGISSSARYQDHLQDIALSRDPLGVETAFDRPISYDLRFDGMITPVGMTGNLISFDLMDTPKVKQAVEKVIGDTDLSATGACHSLEQSGIDTYQIISLMSAGLLGEEKKRRLVPTRWAITAVDDTIGKNLKEQVFRMPWYEGIDLFSAHNFGNHIAVILMPGDWQFEMIEIWAAKSLWAGEKEQVVVDREGRKKSNYSPITGAYYSARLAVLEYLISVKRNARVLVVRWITSDYWAPLGTWVIRETTRKAMNDNPVSCKDLLEVSLAVTSVLGTGRWAEHSTLLKDVRAQKSLEDFF